jgi:phosphopantothenoylcysteine decarboxylase/phosphopantothenate--cysteine ligase
LRGVNCLVTAGPTYEAIDPVRFIGNRSSGKMGIALAEELAARGAEVTLMLGPSSVAVNPIVRNIIRVESSDEMYQAVIKAMPSIQLGIFSAAVADYKPRAIAEQKIKKSGDSLTIELIKTKDILKAVGEVKRDGQILVGFALETQNEVENAKNKIVKKNLDMIVLNSLNDKGAGFQHDTNQISIIDKENKITNFELKSKRDVAVDITNYIETNFYNK